MIQLIWGIDSSIDVGAIWKKISNRIVWLNKIVIEKESMIR